ncbi:MAG: hypothetical protein EB078_03470 [Proteobacteria bacterium]|nr:hypothetical protein [Pseudomonadota bacterium]NDD03942.1 hypothetical protein [Pseudomonadota bacterium]
MKESHSQYDTFAEKLDKWLKESKDGNPSAFLVEDELTVKLSHNQLKSSIDSLKKLKSYRDAVDSQCIVDDGSAKLLVQTLDSCLVSDVLFPGVNKAKLDQDRYAVRLSLKALNTCQSELSAYFQEKEKRSDLTEKEAFKEDAVALKALSTLFENFGGKKGKGDAQIVESSELIKALKKVENSNLCQVKLDKEATANKENSLPELTGSPKDKADVAHKPGSSIHELPKSEYDEKVEETIEEEEQYIPIKAQKKEVAPEPVPQPVQKPAPQPVQYQQPVYQQPKPYQPVPYQPKNNFVPADKPSNSNNPAFIPSAPPPRRGVVGGPAPVAAVPVRPFLGGGGLGLSLGFGTYNSTVTAPLLPPPMPYMPPMPGPMPVYGGMGGGLTGVSSSPRACLVCSSTPVTPMPTLGLGTMLARPCAQYRTGVRQPIGACTPNMVGVAGINPGIYQVPRYPGAPVNPGPGSPAPVVYQPTVGGTGVVPNRTTVPRTVPASRTSLRRSGRR